MRCLVALMLAAALLGLGAACAQGAAPEGHSGTLGMSIFASGWGRVLLHVVASLGVVAILGMAALMFFEGSLVFRPSARPQGEWQPAGLDVEQVSFRTQDGLTLHGWWHPGRGEEEPSRRPVLLWCHGNAGNITHRRDLMEGLVQQGLAVFLFDYRGYGRSEGRPSEPGLYADAEAAYRLLVHRRGVKPERIICFGRSLGTAVALHVALRGKVAGVILEGALENVPAAARQRFPFLPCPFFMRNRFDVVSRVRRLRAPLLVVHGAADKVMPLEQGKKVYAAALPPKQMHVIDGAGHADTHQVGGEDYYKTLRAFCYGCLGRQGAEAPA